MRPRNRVALADLERRRAEAESEAEALRVERDRLASALDALPDPTIVVDATGDVVARNSAATRFANARHGDALVEAAIERLLQAALGGAADQEELTIVGPPRRHVLVRSQPIVLGGSMAGAIASVSDVSELRRVEQVRRDFVANVSHELKTPIGALALLAETIAGLDDLTSESVRGLADRLVREADRLAQSVDELLDLSTLEADESPRRHERVDVHDVIEQAVERIVSAAPGREVPLEIEVDDGPLVVDGDARQLVSAVCNLIDNALKYSDVGTPVEVVATRSESDVVIEVRDQGIGIPARDLERIFERFYRVDRARSRATGGTGLGLSIVRHVVEGHGGAVSVTSVEGEGSTFRLTIPAAS